MPKEPLGVTFTVPDGQEATGVYEADGGADVFIADAPYLLSDGVSRQPPLPVKIVDGPTWISVNGSLQRPCRLADWALTIKIAAFSPGLTPR